MDGGNFANRVSKLAGDIGTASEIGALAAGATGVGAAFTPGLAGLATVMNTTSAVADMFGDGLSVQQAVTASGNLLTASQVRRAFEMGLLQPDQLHDDAYVSQLEYMLEEGSAKPRRYAKYATAKQPKHRPKLNYYHGTTYAKK